MYQPLADKIRQKSLDDVVGQRHLLGENGLLRRVIESGSIPNLIFYGPSGVGKPTVEMCIRDWYTSSVFRRSSSSPCS